MWWRAGGDCAAGAAASGDRHGNRRTASWRLGGSEEEAQGWQVFSISCFAGAWSRMGRRGMGQCRDAL